MTRMQRAIAASVVALSLSACASLVETRVEQTMLDALPRIVGPAARYDVKVSGVTTHDAERGFKRVHAVGERVERPKSPVLDRVDVDLRDVRINVDRKGLTGLGSADAKVRVLASDVARFLEERPGLDLVSVSFHGSDVVMISARPSVAGYSLPPTVSVRGYLLPHGSQLRLNLIDVRAAGIPVGNIATFVIERLINPIVDLSALPAPTRVTGAQIEGGALIVTAAGSELSPR